MKLRTFFMILGLIVVLLASACAATESSTAYVLTHSESDAEYLLDWNTVVDQCPSLEGYPLLEGFARRGEEVEIAPGERVVVPEDSGTLWGSSRLVREGDPNTGDFRSFQVEVSFVESEAVMQEIVKASEQAGFDLDEGQITTGIRETPLSGLPGAATQIDGVVAANRLWVHISALGAGDKESYCGRDEVTSLIEHVAERVRTVSTIER